MAISVIPFDPTMRVLFSSLCVFLLPRVALSLSVKHISFSISISRFWIADVATAVQEVYVGYGSILLLFNLFLDFFSSFNFFFVLIVAILWIYHLILSCLVSDLIMVIVTYFCKSMVLSYVCAVGVSVK
ncbi:uncharacterized protein DS421_2g47320 [Arachis hypogaea]|nr:uncharacterized protein DS421_2g47320 [Arachis hypogaea]